MLWYLKFNLKEISGGIVFDYNIPYIDKQLFHTSNKIVLEEFYPDTEEAIPGNYPPPRVNPVYIGCYVEDDHAVNVISGQSYTGSIIFVNN